jgi:hypothetical protein
MGNKLSMILVSAASRPDNPIEAGQFSVAI